MTEEEEEEQPPSVSYDGGPVGFKKPPARYQFKKGQKPPGSGRKKGQKNRETMVDDILRSLVTVTVNGKKCRVTYLEALLLKARSEALSGRQIDILRFFLLMEKIDPRPPIPDAPILVRSIPGDDTL